MLALFGDQMWVTPYGVALVLALVSSWIYARSRAAANGFDPSHADLIVPVIFILSTAGARGLAFISPGDLELVGGLHDTHVRFRLFGLLLFALPLLFAYCRLANLPFRRILDVFALPAVLWLLILRVGCFMAGCCWGKVSELPIAVSFPAGSLAWEQHVALGLVASDAARSLPVHPTQVYELILVAGLLMVLVRIDRVARRPGELALFTLAGYSGLRFLLEFVRADSPVIVGGLTFTQFLCFASLVAAAFALKRAGQEGGSAPVARPH